MFRGNGIGPRILARSVILTAFYYSALVRYVGYLTLRYKLAAQNRQLPWLGQRVPSVRSPNSGTSSGS